MFTILPSYLTASQASGLFSSNSGIFLDTGQFVRVTGDQDVDGRKSFVDVDGIGAYVISLPGVATDPQIDLVNHILIDSQPVASLDWYNYLLYANGDPSLDWGNKILSGTWNVTNLNSHDGLKISGQSVSTGQSININTGIYFTGAGSGTSGFIPKFTQDGTGLINSNILESGTFLRITPTITGMNGMVIAGDITGDGNVHVRGTALNVVNNLQMNNTTMINQDRSLINLGGIVRAGSSAGLNFQTNAAGTTWMNIDTNGLVGINMGTTTPISRLNISGHIVAMNITGDQFYGGSSGQNVTGYNINALNTLTISGMPVSTGNVSVGEYNLVYTTGNQTIDGIKTFNSNIVVSGIHNSNGLTIDNRNRFLVDSLGRPKYDWQNNKISGFLFSNFLSADFSNGILYQTNGNPSIDWLLLRSLYDSSNIVSIDWQSRILSGAWNNLGSISSNGNLLAESGNLYLTGNTLYNLINNFSGVFNNSGSQYQSQINTLINNLQSTGISLKNTSNLISGNIIQTGIDLGLKINSLSGWVNNTPRISSINVTGFGNQTGAINLSGLGSVIVFTGINNSIFISGSASAQSSLGILPALTGSGVNNNTDFRFYTSTTMPNNTPVMGAYGITGNSLYSLRAAMGNSGVYVYGINNEYFNLFGSFDPAFASQSALFLEPSFNSVRFYVGNANRQFHSISLSNVINGIVGLRTLSLGSSSKGELIFDDENTNHMSGIVGGNLFIKSAYETIMQGGMQGATNNSRLLNNWDSSNRAAYKIYGGGFTTSQYVDSVINLYNLSGINFIRFKNYDNINDNNLTVFNNSGWLGVRTGTPTAYVHLGQGRNIRFSGAPLKFTSGSILTVPESGAIEYDGSGLYFTNNYLVRAPLLTGTQGTSVDTSNFITTGVYYAPTNFYTGFSTFTVDWSSGNVFNYTITGNTTFSFSNDKDGQTIVLSVRNTGTNFFSGTWPSSVRWPYNGIVQPAQTSGSFTDVFTFIKMGTGIFGNVVQSFINF